MRATWTSRAVQSPNFEPFTESFFSIFVYKILSLAFLTPFQRFFGTFFPFCRARKRGGSPTEQSLDTSTGRGRGQPAVPAPVYTTKKREEILRFLTPEVAVPRLLVSRSSPHLSSPNLSPSLSTLNFTTIDCTFSTSSHPRLAFFGCTENSKEKLKNFPKIAENGSCR